MQTKKLKHDLMRLINELHQKFYHKTVLSKLKIACMGKVIF